MICLFFPLNRTVASSFSWWEMILKLWSEKLLLKVKGHLGIGHGTLLYSFAFEPKPILCRPNAHTCHFWLCVKECSKGTAVRQTNAGQREQPSNTPVKALTRPRQSGSVPAFPLLVYSEGSVWALVCRQYLLQLIV